MSTPLWAVARQRRDVVDVATLGPEVAHYSIPNIDVSGGPVVESTEDIYSQKLRVRKGDVLISRLNPRKVRVLAVGDDGAPAVSSTEFVPLVPTKIEQSFLTYCLTSEAATSWLDSQVRSVTRSHQRVDPEVVLRLPLDVPSKEEQRRISGFLDDQVSRLDDARSALHDVESEARLRAEGLWARSYSDLTDTDTVPLRRSLRSITDGPFGSSLTSAHYAEGGTRVVRLGNIGIARFKDEDRAYISDEYAVELKQHAVLPGDVLMAGLGDAAWPLGRSCVAPQDLGPAIVKADCYRIRLRKGWNADYVVRALCAPQSLEAISLLARGATRARLNTEVARQILLPRASEREQAAFVRVVDGARGRAAEITNEGERLRGLLEERKRALITACVTGEFDVSTASTRAADAALAGLRT